MLLLQVKTRLQCNYARGSQLTLHPTTPSRSPYSTSPLQTTIGFIAVSYRCTCVPLLLRTLAKQIELAFNKSLPLPPHLEVLLLDAVALDRIASWLYDKHLSTALEIVVSSVQQVRQGFDVTRLCQLLTLLPTTVQIVTRSALNLGNVRGSRTLRTIALPDLPDIELDSYAMTANLTLAGTCRQNFAVANPETVVSVVAQGGGPRKLATRAAASRQTLLGLVGAVHEEYRQAILERVRQRGTASESALPAISSSSRVERRKRRPPLSSEDLLEKAAHSWSPQRSAWLAGFDLDNAVPLIEAASMASLSVAISVSSCVKSLSSTNTFASKISTLSPPRLAILERDVGMSPLSLTASMATAVSNAAERSRIVGEYRGKAVPSTGADLSGDITLDNLDDALRRIPQYDGQLIRTELRDARAPSFAVPARVAEVPAVVWDMLRERGMERLYTHQAKAVDAALSGSHVMLCTGTSSGKSLAFYIVRCGRTLGEGARQRA